MTSGLLRRTSSDLRAQRDSLVDETSARLAAAWLLSFENHNTRLAYQRDVTAFATWLHQHRGHYGDGAAQVDLRTVTRQEVDAYARACEQDLSRATVARRLASLASYYEYLLDEEAIGRSPVARVRRPRVDRGGMTLALTRKEAAALAQAAESAGPRDAMLVALLLHNGLRVSSAIGLRFADIEPHGHTCVARVTAKGGRVLQVPLTQAACHALEQLGEGRDPGERVLLANDGAELDRYDAARVLVRLARAAGLKGPERVTPHVLRATFATLALKHRPLHVVQEAMGHADPKTTVGYNRARVRVSQHPAFAVAAELDGLTVDADDDD